MILLTKKKFYGLVLLLLSICTSSCMSFKQSDKRIYRKFKKEAIKPQIYREPYKGKTIRYVAAKPIDNTLPTLLFIHGAPGSSDNFFEYLKDKDLSKKANLIVVDRLGYGYSDYGNAETSIEEQSKSIYTIVEKYHLNNLIVVGWSYGVPIAAKMAYHHPTIKHCVLIAGAVSPKDEKYFGIAKLVRWKLTKWLFSKALKVSDKEKMSHAEELTKMESDWKALQVPITYYHGTKDKIVPYKNMDFITNNVNKDLLKAITVKNANHFLLFKKYPLVKNELIGILEKLHE